MSPLQVDILIDRTGHALLTNFHESVIASDATRSSSFQGAGIISLLSPELTDPKQFGFEDCRPTRSSDCFAFGMVIYEVLSGQKPFYELQGYSYAVMQEVVSGRRPARPGGVRGRLFTDDIWNIVGRCWEHNPEDRPRVEYVLRFLEEVSRCWTPP